MKYRFWDIRQFFRISISENFVSEKKFWLRFCDIRSRKESLGFKNLVLSHSGICLNRFYVQENLECGGGEIWKWPLVKPLFRSRCSLRGLPINNGLIKLRPNITTAKTNNSCDHLNSLLDRGRTNFAIRSILSASLSYQSPIYTAKCENVRHPVTARHTHSSPLDGAWCSILMMQQHYNWSGEGATLWLLGVVDWATDGEQKPSHKELSIIQWETPLTNAQFFTTRIYSASQNPFRLSNTCTSHYKGEPHLCWWWNFVYRTCY